jgi:hypothetical protein
LVSGIPADSTYKRPERAGPRGRPLEEVPLHGDGQILETLAAVEDALAGFRPDVGHHGDDVQPIRDAVVGVPDVDLGRDGADVPVVTLERTFPVVIPAFIAVDVAGEQAAFGHHDPVVDGLGPSGHGQRESEENRRQFLDHSAG